MYTQHREASSKQRQYPVGWDPSLVAATNSAAQQSSKSARKNEARKLKKQQQGGGGAGDEKIRDGAAEELKKGIANLDINKEAAPAPVLSESEVLIKRHKALLKKLRQVSRSLKVSAFM